MSVTFTPAKLTITAVPDAIALERETVLALCAGDADPDVLARVRDAINERPVTITTGTRVRLKVEPAVDAGFRYPLHEWDTKEIAVQSIAADCIRVGHDFDYTDYIGPFERLSEVLEVLDEQAEPTAPVAPAQDADDWIAWDFSSKDGPDLPPETKVHTRLRDGYEPDRPRQVQQWRWSYGACAGDIVAYRIA